MADFVRDLYAEARRVKAQRKATGMDDLANRPQPDATPAVPVESLTAGGTPSGYQPPTTAGQFAEWVREAINR